MISLQHVMSRIDAANAEDPNLILVDGLPRPAELVYSERMSAMLARHVPDASDALQMAVRAQHLRRWTIPRNQFPMDRAGYHRWRGELKQRHAEWTAAILKECDVSDDVASRVASLIRKENLKTDPEAQALEDVACLVFLQHYAVDFSGQHDAQKMIGILQKTWRKMSDGARRAALDLPLGPSIRSLVEAALNSSAGPARRGVALGDVAVILAAHGDRGGDQPNATLLSHASALSGKNIFQSVSAGVLRGAPQLEDTVRAAVAGGAKHLAVYPMFMSDGYFTSKVLPQRLDALGVPIDVHIFNPLGSDPRLTALMLSLALRTANESHWLPSAARLLVVGHGSKIGSASAQATRSVAAVIAQSGQFQTVECAFLEEPEFLEDALKRSSEAPTVVLGFFAGDGLHSAEDVPEAISESGAKAVYAGSIGKSPELQDLILSAAAADFGSPNPIG
jgi:sirohydrochlorin ferrochelatase